MEMLHEAQEELKNLRNKTMPNTTSRRYHSLGLFPMVSTCLPSDLTPSSHSQACRRSREEGGSEAESLQVASPFAP